MQILVGFRISKMQFLVPQDSSLAPRDTNPRWELGWSFDEELHFETAYVLRISPHPCEHVCCIDNPLVPASLQGWDHAGSGRWWLPNSIPHLDPSWEEPWLGPAPLLGSLFPPQGLTSPSSWWKPQATKKWGLSVPGCCHMLLNLRPARILGCLWKTTKHVWSICWNSEWEGPWLCWKMSKDQPTERPSWDGKDFRVLWTRNENDQEMKDILMKDEDLLLMDISRRSVFSCGSQAESPYLLLELSTAPGNLSDLLMT